MRRYTLFIPLAFCLFTVSCKKQKVEKYYQEKDIIGTWRKEKAGRDENRNHYLDADEVYTRTHPEFRTIIVFNSDLSGYFSFFNRDSSGSIINTTRTFLWLLV